MKGNMFFLRFDDVVFDDVRDGVDVLGMMARGTGFLSFFAKEGYGFCGMDVGGRDGRVFVLEIFQDLTVTRFFGVFAKGPKGVESFCDGERKRGSCHEDDFDFWYCFQRDWKVWR